MKALLALTPLLLAACAAPTPPIPNDSLAAECPHEVQYAPFGTESDTLADLKKRAEQRLQAIGLQAQWQAPEGQPFTDSDEDRERLRSLLAIVIPAYERYRPALLRHIGLKRLEFVKNLSVAGQLRRAMPAAERDSVVYADVGGPPACPAGIELRAHHELYHFIDHRLFGHYYPRDPAWQALNPAGAPYGAGGATAYGKNFQNLGHPQAGFVSRYALYGPEEDKAELFGWLLTPGYRERVLAWSAQDAALDAKRRFMEALLQRLEQEPLPQTPPVTSSTEPVT
ncbi:hypothetical protein [Inhella proteolytica]|uniref:Lipoprotein n=1 Tax=Inhella proteolytica TaxID=2795029 RepID=A0A931IYM5_9BURK|nr:hypothetical protein [Inhella proteolytica]MBH9575453.1 hypothetical protein [Inhella proteolytica]